MERVDKEDYSEMKAFSLHGHTRPVKRVRFNRDGDMFFTCSDDKTICAWTLDMKKVGVYEGPGACKNLAVSYDTEYIVGAFSTEGFAVFNATNGELLRHFPLSGERVTNMDFSLGDEFLTVVSLGTGRSYVRIYEFKALLAGELSPVKEIQFRDENVS